MSYQYFIAGSQRNSEAIIKLTLALRKKGRTAYSFLETNPLTKLIEDEVAVENWRESETTRKIFVKDIMPLKASACLILLLPAGTSAHIEAGVAYGMKKKCILIGKPEKTESLYMIFDEVYETIEEFSKSLL